MVRETRTPWRRQGRVAPWESKEKGRSAACKGTHSPDREEREHRAVDGHRGFGLVGVGATVGVFGVNLLVFIDGTVGRVQRVGGQKRRAQQGAGDASGAADVAFLKVDHRAAAGVGDAAASVASLQSDVAAHRMGSLGRAAGGDTITVDEQIEGDGVAGVVGAVAIFVAAVFADLGGGGAGGSNGLIDDRRRGRRHRGWGGGSSGGVVVGSLGTTGGDTTSLLQVRDAGIRVVCAVKTVTAISRVLVGLRISRM